MRLIRVPLMCFEGWATITSLGKWEFLRLNWKFKVSERSDRAESHRILLSTFCELAYIFVPRRGKFRIDGVNKTKSLVLPYEYSHNLVLNLQWKSIKLHQRGTATCIHVFYIAFHQPTHFALFLNMFVQCLLLVKLKFINVSLVCFSLLIPHTRKHQSAGKNENTEVKNMFE